MIVDPMTAKIELIKIPNNHDFIENEILKPAPKEAHWVFDCDGTLITGDVASHVAWGLLRDGLSHHEHTPDCLHEHRDAEGDLSYDAYHNLRKVMVDRLGGHNQVYNWETLVQAGLPPKEVLNASRRSVQEALKAKTITFNNPIADLAKKVSANAWIVSGSPKMNVAAVAEHLGVHVDRVLGTLLETVDDIYVPQLAEPGLVWEETKKVVLKAEEVHAPYFVAGDTIGDWHMLEMATHWGWCIVWDDLRHRGREFRKVLEDKVLHKDVKVPDAPGTYLLKNTVGSKHWVIEVKGK